MYERTVQFKNGETRILAGKGVLSKLGAEAARAVTGRTAVIVADENALRHHGRKAFTSMLEAGFKASTFSLPSGEQYKTLDTVTALYHAFHENGISRSDVIIALGGGVAGDLAGFAAATYLRGVAVIQVPTTLLSQVDSCVGGKTGVDLPFGKNLAGAFHQPKCAIADTDTLSTLPAKILNDGMAEVIKYGAIRNKALFETIESGKKPVDTIVPRCLDIKCGIIERDEKDLGERMLLNFGHTLGHAAEKCMDFTGITHGEAVACGMIAAARLGESIGETKPGTSGRLERAVNAHALPTRIDINMSKLVEVMSTDKKRLDGKLNFILLKDIGEAFIRPFTLSELSALLLRM